MIFCEYASPIPGRAFRASLLAELMSTRAFFEVLPESAALPALGFAFLLWAALWPRWALAEPGVRTAAVNSMAKQIIAIQRATRFSETFRIIAISFVEIGKHGRTQHFTGMKSIRWQRALWFSILAITNYGNFGNSQAGFRLVSALFSQARLGRCDSGVSLPCTRS